MFRIRRIFDDVVPVNQQALEQVKAIPFTIPVA